MTFTLTLPMVDLDHFRTMLREQLAGDHELLRHIDAGYDSETLRADAVERIRLVEDIASQIGGLYGSGFAAGYGGGLPNPA